MTNSESEQVSPPDRIPSVAQTPVRALWSAIILLIVMLFVGASVAAVVTAVRFDPAWTSTALVRVGRPPSQGVLGDQFTDPAYVERVLRTVQQMTSGQDLDRAAARMADLPPGEAEDAGHLVGVTEVAESELLTYSVRTSARDESRPFLEAVIARARDTVKSSYGTAISLSVPTESGPTKTTMGLARATLIGGAAALLLGITFVLTRNELRRDP